MPEPKRLTPRARFWTITLFAAAYSVLYALVRAVYPMLSRGVLAAVGWPMLWNLAIGLVLGVVLGLAMIELPQRVIRRGKDRPLARGVLVGGSITTMAVMMSVLTSASSSGGGVFVLLIPIGIGVGLIAAGRASRVGETRHCPECDYEFAFASDEDPDAPIRCPECGTGWLGRLAVGRRVRSIPLLGAGIAVIAATVLLVGTLLSGVGVGRILPTPVLITWLGTSPSFGAGAAWAELTARPLTTEQRGGLASRLLDVRKRTPFGLGVAAKEWLDAEISAGTLPPEVRERFSAEMFTGELDVPRTARVGQPFEVGFRHTDSADGFAYKCYLYVGGFGLGDAPATIGRRVEGFYPGLIDRADRAPYTPLSATLTAEHPGKTVVRADVWLMVQPGSPAEITWTDDGTPVVPAKVVWAKRLEMTREIEVAR